MSGLLHVEHEPKMCRCGRAPRRKGQRNCRLCHAEANRRYRASVKKQSEALKRIKERLDGKSRGKATL